MRHIPFRMAMNDRISGTRRHSKADGLLKDHDERGGNPSALQHSLARCVHAWGTNFALRPHYTTPGALYTFSLVSHMVLVDGFFLNCVSFVVIPADDCLLATAPMVQCFGNIYFKV